MSACEEHQINPLIFHLELGVFSGLCQERRRLCCLLRDILVHWNDLKSRGFNASMRWSWSICLQNVVNDSKKTYFGSFWVLVGAYTQSINTSTIWINMMIQFTVNVFIHFSVIMNDEMTIDTALRSITIYPKWLVHTTHTISVRRLSSN